MTSRDTWLTSCNDHQITALFVRDSVKSVHNDHDSGSVLRDEDIAKGSVIIIQNPEDQAQLFLVRSEHSFVSFVKIKLLKEVSVHSNVLLTHLFISHPSLLIMFSSTWEFVDRIASRISALLHLEALSISHTNVTIAVQTAPTPALFAISSDFGRKAFSETYSVSAELNSNFERVCVHCDTHCWIMIVLTNYTILSASNAFHCTHSDTQWKRHETLVFV